MSNRKKEKDIERERKSEGACVFQEERDRQKQRITGNKNDVKYIGLERVNFRLIFFY